MLMSRVRKALTEKLSDLQIDSIKQLVIDNTKQQDELLSKTAGGGVVAAPGRKPEQDRTPLIVWVGQMSSADGLNLKE